MKPCEQLLLYVQGELGPAEKEAFETHLKSCPACQVERRFLAQVAEGLTPTPAPASMIDALFARTTRKKPLWARFKWELAGLAAAACAACVWTFLPVNTAFDAHGLVAYMNASAEDDFAAFAQDLTDLENYF